MALTALSRREKNLILLGVTFSIVTLLITYILLPYWDKLVQARNDLAGKNAVLASVQKEAQNEGEIDRDIEELKTKLDSLRRRLPISSETAEFLYYVNQAAGETSVSFEGFETRKSRNTVEDNLSTITVKLTITGTYAQTRAFIEKIENLKRINNLTGADINTVQPNRLATSFSLDIYQYNEGDKEFKNGSDIPPPASIKKTDPFF